MGAVARCVTTDAERGYVQRTEVHSFIRPFSAVDSLELLSLFERDDIQGRAERFAPRWQLPLRFVLFTITVSKLEMSYANSSSQWMELPWYMYWFDYHCGLRQRDETSKRPFSGSMSSSAPSC